MTLAVLGGGGRRSWALVSQVYLSQVERKYAGIEYSFVTEIDISPFFWPKTYFRNMFIVIFVRFSETTEVLHLKAFVRVYILIA